MKMATIRIKSGRFNAVVRRQGFKQVSKSFDTKTQAKFWAADVETRMNNGTWIEAHRRKAINLEKIIQWSLDEAQLVKPFGKSKRASMELAQRDIGHLTLDALTVENVMSYARRRRQGHLDRGPVSASTLTQQLSYMSQAVRRAQLVQKIPLRTNPFEEASSLLSSERLTGASKNRDRRPTKEELDIIDKETTGWLRTYCQVALDSAMRQGEIHNLLKTDLDFTKDLILVRDRKDKETDTGRDMVIPMFGPTREALLRDFKLSNEPSAVAGNPVRAASVSDSWGKFRGKYLPAAKDSLKFHDFRHEAVSRLFEKGWDIPQVAAVSGHRDWSQLKRYTNINPEVLRLL